MEPLDAEPGHEPEADAALQQSQWRNRTRLSSAAGWIDARLDAAGFDRAPWLAVALGGGIAAWFVLPSAGWWVALIGLCSLGAVASWSNDRLAEYYPFLRSSLLAVSLVALLGIALVWAKSELIGASPIDRPLVTTIDGRIIAREEQPARNRVRLTFATRLDDAGDAKAIRVNLPLDLDRTDYVEGATLRLRARLMPPAPPMLPGSYNFARAAWFNGLSATGSVIGEPQLKEAGDGGGFIASAQRRLAAHVRSQLGGSPGAIAAAFASGDRGAIDEADDDAMRDAGLTHLLSISGVHVSAVVAAAYFIAIKLLALWPWLALRVRLPVVAAAIAAGAGIGYTLLTGAEVPTVRSCAAALLVLFALALGREPLSMRMLAVAAGGVMLLWPESVVGPSFQMSFAAVMSIIALSETEAVRRFMSAREEGAAARIVRWLAMLLLTGLVIEIALMPIALYHFNRSGLYGALANVIAIPLTTFITMPLIALALLADLFGLGAPLWWLCGKSLDLLLAIAHFTADRPGAVKLLPTMARWHFALFIAGGLWLALWHGRGRLYGFVPVAVGAIALLTLQPPDVLVTDDGRHVALVDADGRGAALLRDTKSDYVRDNLSEQAGLDGNLRVLGDSPEANCNRDFCTATMERGGRTWRLLLSLGRDNVPERDLAAACAAADIVIADRWLPRSCQPRWLKADRRYLKESGGLSINLANRRITSVAQREGVHGWWRGGR
ncbi:DUF4131 domain-containing protein [Altererythrobacter halimionae]|uniref:DUF4131 domain-containing protein n=1 Tax=Alteriqipengyuania halimionae TaxID=1926630 RepID=A0A6I4U0A2_9SPHN|nr:DUF4131 domain-containing protein [Alteriqipengyuania halimionae]